MSETAAILGRRLGLAARAHPGLAQRDRRGVARPATAAAFHAVQQRVDAEPERRVWGHETAREAVRRITAAIADIGAGAGPVATATHGTVMALALARARGADAFALWQALASPDLRRLRGRRGALTRACGG